VRSQEKVHESYPLRTVARLTGLSADVIRAWEKRYGVVSPKRGPRGARLYTADDVALLRLLGRVVAGGRAIGDVARLGRGELQTLATTSLPIEPAVEGEASHAPLVDRVIDAARRFDAAELDRSLTDAVLALGCQDFVRRVAAPILAEVGEQWSCGTLSIAGEHLTSGHLRNLLVGMIRTRRRSVNPTVLLATPSGERHELGILLVSLLVADSGLGLCYLGPDLPADQLVNAAARVGARVVGLSLVGEQNRRGAVEELRQIEQQLPASTELWLGGRDARSAALSLAGSRAIIIEDLDTLDNEIARLRQSTPLSHAP
jgi:DNA-binding transcriptional MerR regulator/methylmalonyl-CoA mutase cobalamin-binding subunit